MPPELKSRFEVDNGGSKSPEKGGGGESIQLYNDEFWKEEENGEEGEGQRPYTFLK